VAWVSGQPAQRREREARPITYSDVPRLALRAKPALLAGNLIAKVAGWRYAEPYGLCPAPRRARQPWSRPNLPMRDCRRVRLESLIVTLGAKSGG
jgi:hypothetical protein